MHEMQLNFEAERERESKREEGRKKRRRNVDEHKAQMEIEKNCTENEDVLTAIKFLLCKL